MFQESEDLLDELNDDLSSDALCDFSISEDDVKSVLSGFDCNKASSPDKVPIIFYVKLKDTISLPLSIVFNRSLSEGVFPDLWKLSFISPIHKSGTKSDVANYRPVSIICAGAKVFEKLVYQFIFAFIMASINPCQHGFSTGNQFRPILWIT